MIEALGRSRRALLLGYVALAAVLLVIAALSHRFLSAGPYPSGPAGRLAFWPWANWDAGWYNTIATEGYTYWGPSRQASVAFFPAYPALMRLGGYVVGDALTAGVCISYAAGVTAVLGVQQLARRHVPEHAGLAVALFALAPFSFYFFGVVYADAVFVAAAVWSFVLFEQRRLWLGLAVGAVATAARPVGPALTLALMVLVVTNDRAPHLPSRSELRGRLRPLAAAAATGAGFLTYLAYLQWRFQEPFAFALVEGAPGWEKGLTLHTLLKVDYFRFVAAGDAIPILALTLGAALVFVGCGLLVTMWRRFGPAYATLTASVLIVPFCLSGDLLGMGRYALAAFPVPLAAAAVLGPRPRWAIVALTTSAGLLGLMYSYYARDFYLS